MTEWRFMMKQMTFNLPDALAEKFELALQLSGDNRDAVAEEFVRGYLARALQSAANEFRTPEQRPHVTPRPVQPQRSDSADTISKSGFCRTSSRSIS